MFGKLGVLLGLLDVLRAGSQVGKGVAVGAFAASVAAALIKVASVYGIDLSALGITPETVAAIADSLSDVFVLAAPIVTAALSKYVGLPSKRGDSAPPAA